jgi:PAS domain-containing protein
LSQSNVEIVLLKQLASCLAMPMFVLGPDGELLFFNESTEPILGRRFDETGQMSADEWVTLIRTIDEDGVPIKAEERPLIAALQSRKPTNSRFWVEALDGRHRHIESTAVPLVDLRGRLFGALGFFWELARDEPVKSFTVVKPSSPRQHAVETILTRRLASKLAMPLFLVDVEGRLLFFNKAAEPILGRRFEDIAATSRNQMYDTFKPTNTDGSAMRPEDHPLWIARVTRAPVHRSICIRGLDGVQRKLEVSAIPLIGQSNRMLGAFGLFWEDDAEGSSGETPQRGRR